MSALAKKAGRKADKIAYAIWLFGDPDETNSGTPTPRDLTLSWLRFGFQGPVIESRSIDDILARAWETGSDACFIQTPGSIISEDWILPHWGKADFHARLRQIIERNDFLVCADVEETNDYYALDTTCLLVDLHRYRESGRPGFGYTSGQPQRLIKPRLTATTSDSPCASARQLEPGEEHLFTAPATNGWGFIDASLRHGLVVPEMPDGVKSQCVSLHADTPEEAPDGGKPLSTKQRFLDGVETQIARGRTGVFLWNIESYDDIPAGDPGKAANTGAITHLYCVAAGFKPNMLLHRHGFEADTRITFFDYSRPALEIRKTLLNEWDGSDYPDFCRRIMQRFPPGETFYQLWNGLQPSQIDWADVDRLWEEELARWGGAAHFQKQWRAQQELDYRFVHCDVVGDPAPLLEAMDDSRGTAIWWSNAFFTVAGNWLLGIGQRRQRFRYWIDRLAERCPHALLYGADHNNTPVNNITAAQYATVLKNRSKGTGYDELTPRRESALPLRF